MTSFRADEVRRLVLASLASPLCHLRIRTKRARAIRYTIGLMRGDHLVWRRAMLHPLFQRGERIDLIGAGTPAAMVHPRRQKQSREIVRPIGPHRRFHLLVILN